MPTGTSMTYVGGGDLTSLRPSRRPRPTRRKAEPVTGLDWSALIPTCAGCGARSGRLDATDRCPTCVTPPSPVAQVAAAPKPATEARRHRNRKPEPDRKVRLGSKSGVSPAGHTTRLTPAFVADVAARYTAGSNTKAIAKDVHCATSTVLRALKVAGVETRPPGLTQYKRDLEARLEMLKPAIVAEYVGGDSAKEVAARYATSQATVLRLVRAAGAPVRGQGGGKAKPLAMDGAA